MDVNSLAHTKWECKYHIVFAPKYRRQVIYKDIKADVGQILGTLCRRKGIEIVEAECCSDHIHMLVKSPPKYSVSEIVGYLKGKSSLMIFEKHANLKYKYGNRHFWCRGYYVDTVGKNTAAIKAYIQNQLKEDLEYDQMSLVEYIDPFTGEPVKRNKKKTTWSGSRKSKQTSKPLLGLRRSKEALNKPLQGRLWMWCSWQASSAPSGRKQVIAPYRGRASHRLSRWS